MTYLFGLSASSIVADAYKSGSDVQKKQLIAKVHEHHNGVDVIAFVGNRVVVYFYRQPYKMVYEKHKRSFRLPKSASNWNFDKLSAWVDAKLCITDKIK